MKKILLGVLLAITTTFAATVGGAKDGKIYDKAYIDIEIGNEKIYQYVGYNGAGFEIGTRTFGRIFDEAKRRGKTYLGINVFGKIELPDDVGNEVLIIVSRYSTKYSSNVKLNGKKIAEKENYVKVNQDKLGKKYVNFEVFAHRGFDEYPRFNNLISGLTFTAKPIANSRGRGSFAETLPIRIYVDEE